jgi:hypothetical protein
MGDAANPHPELSIGEADPLRMKVCSLFQRGVYPHPEFSIGEADPPRMKVCSLFQRAV